MYTGRMRYRHVLFDLDGTLVDSLADIANAVNFARAAVGYEPLGLPAVRGFVGDGMTKLLERAIPEPAHRPRATACFKEHYAAHLADCTRPYTGMVETLDALVARGQRCAVITNKPYAFALPILDRLKLARYFPVVLGGDSTKAQKPSVEPFRVALEGLGAAPGDFSGTLMVGDGHNDIKGARAAGVASCAVLWGFTDEALLRDLQPDSFARVPVELLDLC